MSKKVDTTDMTQETNRELKPRLRFPEFRDAPGWDVDELGKVSFFVNERMPLEQLSQANYVSTENILPDYEGVIKASKLPSSGSVTRFRANDILVSNIRPYLKKVWLSNQDGGASNDIVVVRAKEKLIDQYLSFVLKNDAFIAYVMRGAKGVKMPRGDISLIKEYPLAYPSKPEQQKIVDCLASIDELIAAQSQKLDSLKGHKNGLLQRLFPAEGETLPQLRFPEFQDVLKWEVKKLGDIATIKSGTTPLRSNSQYYDGGTIPWVKTTDLNDSFIYSTEERITPYAKARINPEGSILVAMYGGFNQIGRTGYLRVSAATNQAISVLNTNQELVIPLYLLIWLNAKVDNWKTFASSSRKDPNITGADVANFPIIFPSITEQQKIADCVSSIDEQIAAQIQKLKALKDHKKGLIQQLFPVPDEVQG